MVEVEEPVETEQEALVHRVVWAVVVEEDGSM